MINKLLYLEWTRNKARNDNRTNFIISSIKYMVIPCLLFLCFLGLRRAIDEKTYLTIITKVSISGLFIMQLLIKMDIKNIRKDPIILFIKKDRHIFIRNKIELKIYKMILLFIIPIFVPLLIYSNNKGFILIQSILIIVNIYLLNMIIAYTVSYFDAISNSNIIYKIAYILGIILFIFLAEYIQVLMIGEIIDGLRGKNTGNIHFQLNNTILIITAIIGTLAYIAISKLVKENLYIFLNPFSDNVNVKGSLLNKFLKLNIKNLYIKILIKDLCSFTRKRGMNLYGVVIFQIGTFIFYCATVLQDRPEGLTEKMSLVAVFYFVICFISISVGIGIMSSNKDEINIDEEYEVINKFGIKVNKLKILKRKADYIFILLSVPVILTGITNLILDISINGLIQTIFILVSILSWIRYYSLIGTDIVNYGINQIRIFLFAGISIFGAKIIFSMFEVEIFEDVNILMLEYLIIIFINVLGYFIELLLIRLLERKGKND
ncbi:hypothetical protein [Clostridium sp. DL1XJH146]